MEKCVIRILMVMRNYMQWSASSEHTMKDNEKSYENVLPKPLRPVRHWTNSMLTDGIVRYHTLRLLVLGSHKETRPLLTVKHVRTFVGWNGDCRKHDSIYATHHPTNTTILVLGSSTTLWMNACVCVVWERKNFK